MIAWAKSNLVIILIVLVGLAVLFTFQSCQRERTAKTRENVATGQTGAAVESGKDAVTTIGNRADADAAGDAMTRDNDAAIRGAEGADAVVAPAARDAGLAALCRRPAYREAARCKALAK